MYEIIFFVSAVLIAALAYQVGTLGWEIEADLPSSPVSGQTPSGERTIKSTVLLVRESAEPSNN